MTKGDKALLRLVRTHLKREEKAERREDMFEGAVILLVISAFVFFIGYSMGQSAMTKTFTDEMDGVCIHTK